MQIVNPQITVEYIRSNATGKGVRVAVIDSGVDASHPDLKDRLLACYTAVKTEGEWGCRELSAAEATDAVGHGTGVLGVVAQVAPECDLISIQLSSQFTRGKGEALLACLDFALELDVSVVNLSLTSSKTSTMAGLQSLAQKAYEKEILLVAAKRNMGHVGYPASFPSVIGVDNGDYDDPFHVRFFPKSVIEFAARGTRVRVPSPGEMYKLVTGTSFATPHVTGVVALLRELYPQITVWQAKSILHALAGGREDFE